MNKWISQGIQNGEFQWAAGERNKVRFVSSLPWYQAEFLGIAHCTFFSIPQTPFREAGKWNSSDGDVFATIFARSESNCLTCFIY